MLTTYPLQLQRSENYPLLYIYDLRFYKKVHFSFILNPFL